MFMRIQSQDTVGGHYDFLDHQKRMENFFRGFSVWQFLQIWLSFVCLFFIQIKSFDFLCEILKQIFFCLTNLFLNWRFSKKMKFLLFLGKQKGRMLIETNFNKKKKRSFPMVNLQCWFCFVFFLLKSIYWFIRRIYTLVVLWLWLGFWHSK